MSPKWIESIVVLAVALGAMLIVGGVCTWLASHIDGRRRGVVLRAIFAKLPLPFTIWVWLFAFSWVGEIFISELPWTQIRGVILIAALAWFALRVRTQAIQDLAKTPSLVEPTQVAVMAKLVTLAVWIFTVLGLMHVWGVDYRALLTFGGVGAIAIGLAGQQVFSNFIAGCVLYATCPFKIGDRIKSPDRKLEGQVQHMGWYMTRLRGDEGKPLYVPNSIFTSVTILNLDRED